MTHPSPLSAAALCAAVSVLLVSAPATAQGFKWVKTVDEALEKAKTEKKVVLFAVNLEGEWANDQLVRHHYQDPLLTKLSDNMVCVFCSAFTGKPATAKTGLHTNANKNNERIVRSRFLKANPDQWIVAPQHIFVGPDGKILSSVSYRVTEGELEWMMVNAIRQVNPAFEWTPSNGYRAPASMRKGAADDSEGREPPPTAKQVRQALENITKERNSRQGRGGGGGRGGRGGRGGGRGAWGRISADMELVIRSDRPEALKWGKVALRSRWTGRRLMVAVGEKSPIAWAKIAADHITNNNADMRLATAIALENLRDPKTLSKLKAGFRKEDELDVQGRMLRAMAAVAPTNSGAKALIQRTLKTHKAEYVRAHATVAVGLLEDRSAVTAGLTKALQDKSGLVRSVAAYVIAIRQDKEMLQHLKFSLKSETEADVKRWMEEAVTAVTSGDNRAFKNFLKDTLDNEDVAREAMGEPRRNRGRGRGGRGRGGEGRGGGEGDGGEGRDGGGDGEGPGREGGRRRRGRERRDR